jgi:AcrR family transcriptional regulator
LPSETKPTQGEQRAELLAVAARMLEESGPETLRARELTAEVGTSTQALYTLFGGMPGLFEALVADGFRRFAEYVAAVPETDDPVADFFSKGRTYMEWALTHPQLYRLMFGITGDGLRRHAGLAMTGDGAMSNSPEAQSAMDVMVHSMDRVVASGRVRPVDPVLASGQFLSATHGYVLLGIAGIFPPSGEGLEVARAFGVNLMVGLGDSPEAAQRSMSAIEASDVESG